MLSPASSRLPISLAVALLASTALTADRNKLPAQFVGEWCLDNPGDDKASLTYRLGRCLPDQNNSSEVADGFVAHESRVPLSEVRVGQIR